MSIEIGPDDWPPSDRFVYSCPRARAALVVNCSGGASARRLNPWLMKFDPERSLMFWFAPLKPPRATSYGEIVSDVIVCASRGRFDALEFMPFSVVLFWSGVRPSTEKPEGSPFAPAT